jgi:phosphohistidine phosphatase
MDLILWRHAEAEAEREGETDLDRDLTTKGTRQAKRMAHWLNQRLAASTKVLVSPALRTRSTALALGRKFRVVPALAPDASVDDLLQAARWPMSIEPVLLVGHQPTLGLLAAHLLAQADQPWAIKKGGVWWLRRRDGSGELFVQAVQSPDSL